MCVTWRHVWGDDANRKFHVDTVIIEIIVVSLQKGLSLWWWPSEEEQESVYTRDNETAGGGDVTDDADDDADSK